MVQVRTIGCATGCLIDDVAVCTCLIVVAVANTTATLKAIVSAIKTNFGPILRPPRSISTVPTNGQLGRLVNPQGESMTRR